MRVKHSRADILVSQEFLYRTDIVAVFEEMGGKAVAQGVTASTFWDVRALKRLFHSPLQDCFRYMMSTLHTRTRINGASSRRKDILPDPGGAGMRVFPIKGIRQVHLPVSRQAIVFVEKLCSSELSL